MTNRNCPKCGGKGMYKDKEGTIQTCWDCLQGGEFDQDFHSKIFRKEKGKN